MGPAVQIVQNAIESCDGTRDSCPVSLMMGGTEEAMRRGLVIQVKEACRLALKLAEHCRPALCPAQARVEEVLRDLEPLLPRTGQRNSQPLSMRVTRGMTK